jgi:heme/copper-type cytochrome/quinol oxidase subunit 3
VLAGVIWALWVVRRARRGAYADNPIGVEIFGLYWHFVDVVWIVIFTVIYLI